MARLPKAPHFDELGDAIRHFNASFRHRYRLPEAIADEIRAAHGFAEAWADIPTVRAGGVADASCAVVARGVLSIMPRYAIGLIAADGSTSRHP